MYKKNETEYKVCSALFWQLVQKKNKVRIKEYSLFQKPLKVIITCTDKIIIRKVVFKCIIYR